MDGLSACLLIILQKEAGAESLKEVLRIVLLDLIEGGLDMRAFRGQRDGFSECSGSLLRSPSQRLFCEHLSWKTLCFNLSLSRCDQLQCPRSQSLGLFHSVGFISVHHGPLGVRLRGLRQRGSAMSCINLTNGVECSGEGVSPTFPSLGAYVRPALVER